VEIERHAEAVQHLPAANDSQAPAQSRPQMLGVCTSDKEAQRTTQDQAKGIIMTPTLTALPVEPKSTKRESAIRSEVWRIESQIMRRIGEQEPDFACEFLMALQERVAQLTVEQFQKWEHAKQNVAEREAAMLAAKPGDSVELLESGHFATSMPDCPDEFQFQKGEVFQLVKLDVDHNGCCVVIDKDEITARIPRHMLRLYQPPDVLPKSGTIRVGGYVRLAAVMDLFTTRMVVRRYTPQHHLLVTSISERGRDLTVTDSAGCTVRVMRRMVVPIEPDLPPTNKPHTTEEVTP